MSRPVAGRVRYATPPEAGTLLGPKDTTREPMVVVGHDGDHTLVGYATTADIMAAVQRMADGAAPRSIAEHDLVEDARALAARQAAEVTS